MRPSALAVDHVGSTGLGLAMVNQGIEDELIFDPATLLPPNQG